MTKSNERLSRSRTAAISGPRKREREREREGERDKRYTATERGIHRQVVEEWMPESKERLSRSRPSAMIRSEKKRKRKRERAKGRERDYRLEKQSVRDRKNTSTSC